MILWSLIIYFIMVDLIMQTKRYLQKKNAKYSTTPDSSENEKS